MATKAVYTEKDYEDLWNRIEGEVLQDLNGNETADEFIVAVGGVAANSGPSTAAPSLYPFFQKTDLAKSYKEFHDKAERLGEEWRSKFEDYVNDGIEPEEAYNKAVEDENAFMASRVPEEWKDRYNELIKSGKKPQEAFDKVIDEKAEADEKKEAEERERIERERREAESEEEARRELEEAREAAEAAREREAAARIAFEEAEAERRRTEAERERVEAEHEAEREAWGRNEKRAAEISETIERRKVSADRAAELAIEASELQQTTQVRRAYERATRYAAEQAAE